MRKRVERDRNHDLERNTLKKQMSEKEKRANEWRKRENEARRDRYKVCVSVRW